MRRWLAFLIFCIFSTAAYSHPGKTDLYGGHKCFKKCENWGLLFDEYHLHDKDGKPIRVAKKKAPRKPPVRRKAVDEVTQAVQEPVQETVSEPVPAAVSQAAVLPRSPEAAVNPLLLALLAFLFLLLFARVRRRRLNTASQDR